MDFLAAFATGIVGKIAEFTVAPVVRQVGYVIQYNRNLKKLKTKVGDLADAGEIMKHAIETEEMRGKKIETGVRNWLTKVDEMTKEANDFLKDEQHEQIRCLHGFCPNLKRRHHLSRKSTQLVEDVAEIYGKKDFPVIAYDVKPQEVCNISKDYQAFDSRMLAAKKIMNELTQSTDIIGVYGIGGVGKTTLVKEVYRQATEETTLYDDVVIVLDIKKIPDLEGIQKRIAEKLGMDFLGDETTDKRASRLFGRIKDKKVLVILDDIHETVDLETLGIPRGPNCKILLTARTRDVLSVEMRTQKEFQLDLLDSDENWSLFEKMAGDVLKDPSIREVAKQVAMKCGGLPVLVVTVASALKNRSNVAAWEDALRRLKAFDKQGLTEKAYLALEWSYEQLDDVELKPLFLLSGIIRGYSINLLDLLKYSMGLGLIKSVGTLKEAENALHSLVEKLKDSCLLLEDSDRSGYVKMHDLVHEVVIRIATRNQHVFKVAIEDEFIEWPIKEFCTKCTMIMITIKNCSSSHLPEGLECPELKMCIFKSGDVNQFLEIPSNFFEGMKKLRVLDFTLWSIPSLPPSLQLLKSLQTLCLDQCNLGDLALVGELRNLEILSFLKSKFKELPKEIGQLTCLRLLDLNGCSQLEVISPNVLSNLKRLEILRIGNSFNQWEDEGVIVSERRNANIGELKHLSQLTALQIHIPDANILPAELFTTSKLERFQICIGSPWKWDDLDEALNALKLTANSDLDQGLRVLLEKTEDLYLEGTEGVNNSIVYQLGTEGCQKLKHLHVQTNDEFMYSINKKVGYLNLTWLAVDELNCLRYLLSSSMARSLAQLKRLQVSRCHIMEEIILIEESEKQIVDSFFCQLQDLELIDLPNLSKFCSRNYAELSNPSSRSLQLVSSIKTETIYEEIEETTRNLDIMTKHFLLDIKVEFPNLKKLSIHGLAKLTTIWNNNLSLQSSRNLETVEIVSCDNLKSIFPASMAKNLQQLRSLIVNNCGVEEIISKEDETQTRPLFVFSKLTYVRFEKLPRLVSLYPGLHSSKWPSLVTLVVYNCNDEVQTFAKDRHELINPNKKCLFALEKEVFPNLESLGLHIRENWDSPPVHLLRKLKTLRTYADTNSSLNSLEELLGIEKVNEEINVVGYEILPLLKALRLHGMRKLTNLGDDTLGLAGLYFPKVEFLELSDCDSLKNLRSSAIPFRNLITLQVTRCKGLKYLVSFSMAKSLTHLTKFEVRECEELIEIAASCGSDDSANEFEFRALRHLELSDLPSLRGFCSRTRSVKFLSLESLSMTSCTQLEGFIFDPTNDCTIIGKDSRDKNSNENIGVVQQFLFDNKVEFPRLKSLSLKGLPKLSTIWHNLPSTQLQSSHFENLDHVEIDSCENLINIFPTSVARNLPHLKQLLVTSCGVKEIIAREEGLQTIPDFKFPKVTRVKFHKLPQLTNFYPGMHVSSWPSLLSLAVISCLKVNKLGEEISSFHGYVEQEHLCNPIPRSLFLIDKESFPNLETLVFEGSEIWEGQLPVHLFNKLKHLDVAALQSKSAVFLERNNTSSSSSVVGTGTHPKQQQLWQLPHLTHLRLVRMENLMHLGQEDEEDNSQSAPNIPNLQILDVNGCDSLGNLRSSAICFNNLTTLRVSFCDRLENLITYSMAKSLTQLTTLKVKMCPILVVIVGSINEDDDSRDEITFGRLKHLKLSGLPRLQSFCSGNCIAKFPSLETSTMSNRLKLKISAAHDQTLQLTTEEEDTDVDSCGVSDC